MKIMFILIVEGIHLVSGCAIYVNYI